ncbi:hypothetical protein BBO99_00008708 [Phytophthora kernoviae]|uniref:Poly(A) polymerase nucleotidyltransferase domain-containing protein n=2 Tax=Phytophthora kernoviae TaxID=325452 RepID=A0A3R7FX79_9STRA|nr:hypothetical protein G195_010539 [Phytophthora kernoviae 00238/432]KAG2511060.1 hypothetical protein JM18_008621 [Phytophthora kernoviae]RLM97609.1 hypothetical protein BBI17_008615 [Phytophthora kernoviae]RLN74844.1 hypothetical protein BBO99_00008708 [Phytophthora kernoviae]
MDPSALQSFVEFVDDISPTDAPEARMHKLQVLKQLSDLLTKWVKMVGRERALSEEHIALTKGSLFLAGSYRLGLDDPNSDIDAVCVVPWHVTHDDFFTSFCRVLGQTSGVSHLAPVPNAYVPLISLSFLGVRMDLLFSRLPVSSIEANQNIDSDHMLVGVHDASMKSLNAPRVSSMLLCLVPRRREFRIVLRAGPGSCMFIGIEFHSRRQQTIQPKDDPEVKKTLEQTIRFFLATDLQQMEDKQPDMTADARVMSWEELPKFVFGLDRSGAELERAKYTDDLEKMGFSHSNTPSFRPPYYVNSYSRNGKWRNGPRKYAGGQRKQRRDFRNAPRSYPFTQAG